MAANYQTLKNEYVHGGSKSMIAFVDLYLAENEYDDSFAGFLAYLYEIEGRLTASEYNNLTERMCEHV